MTDHALARLPRGPRVLGWLGVALGLSGGPSEEWLVCCDLHNLR